MRAGSPSRPRWLTVSWQLGRGDVPAGVVDSGLSSVATFLVGLAAVRYLPLDTLGTYALGYIAFLLAGNIPGVLIFTPAEVLAVSAAEGRARLGVLPSSLRRAAPVSLAAALAVSAAVVVVPSTTAVADRVLLAATLVAFASLSPVQDHLRRVLHAAGRSWDAAATSVVQTGVVVVLLAWLLLTDAVDAAWMPFGVLAVAKALSLGYALARARPRSHDPVELTWRRALSQGGVLVWGSVAQFGSGFLVIALVTARSGPEAIAQFEAARLASQPVTVIITGLLAVLGPRAMTAAAAGDRGATLRLITKQLLLIVVVAGAWTAFAMLPWSGNPVRLAAPRAYDVELLLPFIIFSQTLAYSIPVFRVVPLVKRVSRSLLALDVLGASFALGAAALLVSRGPWAVALSATGGSVLVLTGCVVLASRLLPRGAVRPG